MTPELTSLTWVAALSALMWLPYVLNAITVRGLVDAVGYPDDPKPMAAWAERMKAAHYNAVENLVLFDPRPHRPRSRHQQPDDRTCLSAVFLGTPRAPRGLHAWNSLGSYPGVCHRLGCLRRIAD